MTKRKPTRRKQLGITDEQYEMMLAAQGGHCALCSAVPQTRRLDVDHDHATGRVRGLLCHWCNRRLGQRSTPAWLRDAAIYLERSTADATAGWEPLLSSDYGIPGLPGEPA